MKFVYYSCSESNTYFTNRSLRALSHMMTVMYAYVLLCPMKNSARTHQTGIEHTHFWEPCLSKVSVDRGWKVTQCIWSLEKITHYSRLIRAEESILDINIFHRNCRKQPWRSGFLFIQLKKDLSWTETKYRVQCPSLTSLNKIWLKSLIIAHIGLIKLWDA